MVHTVLMRILHILRNFLLFCIIWLTLIFFFFFFNDTATTEIYTLSLHDALPIFWLAHALVCCCENELSPEVSLARAKSRSEEHTSELQSRLHLVCRLLLEKKKNKCCPPSTSHTTLLHHHHEMHARHGVLHCCSQI